MKRISGKETKDNIGMVLKAKRIEKGISQSELSQRINKSRTFLNLIENGRRYPSYETFTILANELGEDVTSLLEEARMGKEDPETRMAYLLIKLIKSKDEYKLAKLVEFVESLS